MYNTQGTATTSRKTPTLFLPTQTNPKLHPTKMRQPQTQKHLVPDQQSVSNQAVSFIMEETDDSATATLTFQDLGLEDALCEACQAVGYQNPTPIQEQAIPAALQGRDVVGIAKTGSGKTAAFVLPVLHSLLNSVRKTHRFHALVMAPTRELAQQIQGEFNALGAHIGLKTALLVGGLSLQQQQDILSRNPHVIIATPGRIIHHLEKTNGFRLTNLKFFILDEADRMLTPEFEREIDQLLGHVPKARTNFLFSATSNDKVQHLMRAVLRNPVHIKIKNKIKTVETLDQLCVFVPLKFKKQDLQADTSVIIFCETKRTTMKLVLLLRALGLRATCLHGNMSQEKRIGALARFKSHKDNVMVCTNVGARGLDIQGVELVVNFDLPKTHDVYVHRVGRTARAGRSGRAVTFVTQYDVPYFKDIEEGIGMKLQVKTYEEECKELYPEIDEASRTATKTIKEMDVDLKKNKRSTTRGGKVAKRKKNY
eukprot:gene7116-443_t